MSWRRWWVLSLLFLASLAGWTGLSFRFHYGEGHAERPILLFLLLVALTFACYSLALTWASRGTSRPRTSLVLTVAILARLILLPSNLIQENDVYRYVHDGQLLLHGENPYRVPPAETRRFPVPKLAREVMNPAAQRTLERISYSWIPSPYPPGALVVFATGAVVSGWDWIGQRWVLVAFDALLLLLIGCGLPAGGGRSAGLLLYAWNPLVLKEIANSAHLDVLVAVGLVAMFLALRRYGRAGSMAWLVVAAGCFGAAILFKIYPLLLLPALAVWLFRSREGYRAVLVLVGVSLAVCAAGYAPFLLHGGWETFDGLRIYARRWQMNEGAFLLLQWLVREPRLAALAIAGLAALVIPLARISQPIPAPESEMGSSKGVRSVGRLDGGHGLVCAALDRVRRIRFQLPFLTTKPGEERGLRDRSTGPQALVRQCYWVLLIWLLFLPSPFPWYAVPLVALAGLTGLAPAAASIRSVTWVMSGAWALYYLSFYGEYHGLGAGWWLGVRAVEHGLIWGALALGLLSLRRHGARGDLAAPESVGDFAAATGTGAGGAAETVLVQGDGASGQ